MDTWREAAEKSEQLSIKTRANANETNLFQYLK